MPFKVQVFQRNVASHTEGATRDKLLQACQDYTALTTPLQKAQSICSMMALLDDGLDVETRWAIMEACGRCCITATVLAKARRLQQQAHDLDELLSRLNEAHISGVICGETVMSFMQPMIAATVAPSAKRVSLFWLRTAAVPVVGIGSSLRRF